MKSFLTVHFFYFPWSEDNATLDIFLGKYFVRTLAIVFGFLQKPASRSHKPCKGLQHKKSAVETVSLQTQVPLVS